MNSEQLSESIRSLVAAMAEASDALSSVSGLALENAHIEDALVEVMGLNSSADLLGKGLTADSITFILDSYDFHRLFPKLIAEVRIARSIIPDGTPRKLIEVTIRDNGEEWRIHQNDADPFPSNPHAHNLESGLKLHLGTGELFLKRRNTDKKIPRKTLMEIRQNLKKHKLPPLCA